MGFERLCMALQGKKSNYDTDVFQPLIKAIGTLAGKDYGKDHDTDVAMRVVADHVRTIAFSIADGQLPSNAKAGYVIRRILRRAVRYGYTFLGFKEAFMHLLVDTLIESMGEAYPELPAQADLIKHVIKEEEDAFLRTIDTGMKMIDGVIAKAKAENKAEIDGAVAFTLYDTYGFPLDLTELILKENKMTVNKEQFDAEMAKQKQRARNAAAVEASDWVELQEGVTEFVGYDLTECETKILRYRHVVQKKNEFYQVVLATTPFYAEMGGQVGDKGWLINGDEKIEIIDTKRENNLPVHIVKKMPANPSDTFVAQIDVKARQAIACNHTATHLLHYALRQVLGTHVEQKGSYVDAHMLRFDFSHFKKMTDEEIRQVEHLANALVRQTIARDEHREVPIAQAREMGAMALFGEKYGDKVRVIKYGDSVELCGGTHVANTGNIGMIKIVSESSIAAGIRRIEAITAANVEDAIDNIEDTLKGIKELFNNAPDLTAAINKFILENASLHKQVDEFIKERVKMTKEKLYKSSTMVSDIAVLKLQGLFENDIVKSLALSIKGDKQPRVAFIAATHYNDKPMLTIALSDDLVQEGMNAGQIIREAAKLIKGGGGGQPGFAQAGGKDVNGLDAAMSKIIEMLS